MAWFPRICIKSIFQTSEARPLLARTFAVTPEYLEMTTRGVASANWLHDYGLQTSRGFRALKVWMSLKEHGIEKFAA